MRREFKGLSELDIIKRSAFFDEEYYYTNRPDVKMAGVDAAYHYLCQGWKEGANPSKLFSTKMYMAYKDVQICPLIDYEKNGCKGDYSFRGATRIAIALYRVYKKFRRAKTACYMYISEGYDDLISHRHVVFNWDYICFTNDEELIKCGYVGIWEIKPALEKNYDNKRNSGWHKTHPEECCKNYESSVWIDGNINVLNSFLYKTVKKPKFFLLVPKHYKNDCIYQEIESVKQIGRDSVEKCNETKEFLKKEGMPEYYGLNETNIIFRKHKNTLIQRIDKLWWDCIKNYSKRDQLSFSYCLFKNNLKPDDIALDNARIDYKNFIVGTHEKSTHT